jgi:hypothetical protein
MHTHLLSHTGAKHMFEHAHFGTAIRRGQSPPSAAAALRLQAHPFHSPSVSAYVHRYSHAHAVTYLELPQAEAPQPACPADWHAPADA